MSSLWFVPGVDLASIDPDRGAAFVARAFLPDRASLASGELACARGRVVRGALCRASEGALAALGVVGRGDLRTVHVLTVDGGVHAARARFVEAAGDAPIDALAADALAPKAVFVYGTLRAGEERHGSMQRADLRRTVDAKVPGRLLDLGEYPGLVPARALHDTVVGELYEYDDPTELLGELDDIEDFFGYDSEASLYRRALVEVASPEGPALAWVYVYAGDVRGARVVPGGDWKRRG